VRLLRVATSPSGSLLRHLLPDVPCRSQRLPRNLISSCHRASLPRHPCRHVQLGNLPTAPRNSQFAMRNHHASPHVRPWYAAVPPIVDHSSPVLHAPFRAQSGISLLSMAARLVPKQPLPAPCYARSGPAHRGYSDDYRLKCSSTLHRADRYLTLCATLSLAD
jgi:hypothetical protein